MCKGEDFEKCDYRETMKVGFKLMGRVERLKSSVLKVNSWLLIIRAIVTALVWASAVQLVGIWLIRGPSLFNVWPPCTHLELPAHAVELANKLPMPIALPPKRVYKNNGYLMVSCNGGLNQMRAAICDMVAVARYLNVTLIVPELDKNSFWAASEFQDVFDVDHFIASLRDEVRILRILPPKLKKRPAYSLPPVSWSNMSYYLHQILPLVQKYKVVHLNKTDARVANNGLPLEFQKLRCRVNFHALRFTSQIEEVGRKLVGILREKGPFLALHLRYEMDMLAFSGCSHGCSNDEVEELTRMRYANPLWKIKDINSETKRLEGLCPLTPEETALVLVALGVDHNVQIYIAAGEMYGGNRRMEGLKAAFPNLVRKETLLEPSDLRFFPNHSSQMAALDYLVSLESDIFIPTYDGNMAKVVEGHRRFLGFKKTVLLDRRLLIGLIEQFSTGSLSWDEFSYIVKEAHANRMGNPKERVSVPDKPKEEDYFYSNPHECLQLSDGPLRTT
ncbi:hypothetical protein ACFX1T_023735 [Malus domestica]